MPCFRATTPRGGPRAPLADTLAVLREAGVALTIVADESQLPCPWVKHAQPPLHFRSAQRRLRRQGRYCSFRSIRFSGTCSVILFRSFLMV